MDFLLVLIELSSLSVTAEALQANIGSKSAISLQRGHVDPKFQVNVVAPAPQKTRLNVLSYCIKYELIFLPFCYLQFTRFTDGQTDRQTDGQSDLIARPRRGIPCVAVKNHRVQLCLLEEL